MLPRLLTWNKGNLFLREWEGAGKRREREGGEGRLGEGNEKEGREGREVRGEDGTGSEWSKGAGKEWRNPVYIFKFSLE